ncbi:MAG: DUF4097 family beta strand repeat protein [Spirochaetaceae bacterium]|nr:MAG: DUF4097 family beta strand repeat protein [Spirochaetaceae bacterium]
MRCFLRTLPKFRLVILATSALLVASALHAVGGAEPDKRLEIIRELPAKAELVIELLSAACTVESGSDGRILLRVVSSYPEDRYQVDIRERSGELYLRERLLQRPKGFATWYLTVPDSTGILFSSSSGDFESTGDYRALEARSASGGIFVRDLSGRILINTASGAVRLEDLSGDMSVATASGDVEVADCQGRLSLHTAAGALELRDVVAEIEATTVAGSIAVSELRLSGECSFSSTAGDIEVGLAATPTFDLTLTSAAGSVELDFNDNRVAGTIEFSALRHAGRIESPFEFDRQEVFAHSGQIYDLKSLVRGEALPRITLATASGRARLKL